MLLSVRAEIQGIEKISEKSPSSSSAYTMHHLHNLNQLTPSSIFFPPDPDSTAATANANEPPPPPPHSPFHLTPDLDSLDLDCTELSHPTDTYPDPHTYAADDLLLTFPTLPPSINITIAPPQWLLNIYTSLASYRKHLLTDCSPPLGYFIAGGFAGAVSRTATAPLDRLKVYLIAQTGKQKAESVEVLQRRGVVGRAVMPFATAVRELMRAGGWKSLFAGELSTF